MTIKIGIVGSRRRNSPQDKEQVEYTLTLFLLQSIDDVVIISGGCPLGADRFAEELAEKYHIPITIHKPNKSKLPNNPQKYHYREINYARNELIARDSDYLIACVAPDRKGGTENTIEHFLKTFKKPHKNLIVLDPNPKGFDL